jgi:hypothetical protein
VIDGRHVSVLPPTKRYNLPNAGSVLCWYEPDFTAELVLARPDVRMALNAKELAERWRQELAERWSTRSVLDWWAGVWRIKADQALGEVVATCRWDPDIPTGMTADEEPGEDQEALVWTDGAMSIVMSTEELDYIPGRVEYLDSGLRVPLGEVTAGNIRQTHFQVAWAPEETGIDAWLVAGLSRFLLLPFLGCAIRPT